MVGGVCFVRRTNAIVGPSGDHAGSVSIRSIRGFVTWAYLAVASEMILTVDACSP